MGTDDGGWTNSIPNLEISFRTGGAPLRASEARLQSIRDVKSLGKYLDVKIGAFYNYERSPNYWLTVEGVDGCGMAIHRREANPRDVAGQLLIAKMAISGVHQWLDNRQIFENRPPEPATLDSLAVAARELINLKRYLGALNEQSPGKPLSVSDDAARRDTVLLYLNKDRQRVFRELWDRRSLTFARIASLRGNRQVSDEAERKFANRLSEVFDEHPEFGVEILVEAGGISLRTTTK